MCQLQGKNEVLSGPTDFVFFTDFDKHFIFFHRCSAFLCTDFTPRHLLFAQAVSPFSDNKLLEFLFFLVGFLGLFFFSHPPVVR